MYIVIYQDIVKGRFEKTSELLNFLFYYLKVYYEDYRELGSRKVYHNFNTDIYTDKSPRYVGQYNLKDAKESKKWFNNELLKDLCKAAKQQEVEVLEVESL